MAGSYMSTMPTRLCLIQNVPLPMYPLVPTSAGTYAGVRIKAGFSIKRSRDSISISQRRTLLPDSFRVWLGGYVCRCGDMMTHTHWLASQKRDCQVVSPLSFTLLYYISGIDLPHQ